VKFFAFSLVKAEGVDFQNSRINQLNWLKEQGFEVVEGYEVTADTIEEKVAYFAERI
jgi:DNA ligase (NAD+)